MKKLITQLLLLVASCGFAQDQKPPNTATFKPVQSPFFFYNLPDSSVWVNKGQIYGWTKLDNARDPWYIKMLMGTDTVILPIHKKDTLNLPVYKLKGDSISLHGYVTGWKMEHYIDSIMGLVKLKRDSVANAGYFTNWKALQHRKLNDHDSLSTLQEKNYSSLDGKPDLSSLHASGSDNQTLTITGTTAPTIALSGSNTATFSSGTGITLGQSAGTITVTNSAPDTYGAVSKGNLTENITGLEFDATRQVIGGASQLSLTTGYGIPTTTQIGNIHASGSDNQTSIVGISGTTAQFNTALSDADFATGGGTATGTNTGDESTATIKSKLGITTLSGSNTGDQDLSGLAPISGGGNYIQNQNAVPQIANSWISGTSTALYHKITSGTVAWGLLGSGNSTYLTDWDTATKGLIFNNLTGSAVFNSTVQATQFQSTVATGTAPLTVASTTLVSNLNADMLDGVHLSGLAQGSGTTNYIPKWTGSGTLGNSPIYTDGTNVGIGTTNPSEKLHVVGNGLFNGNITAYYGGGYITMTPGGASASGYLQIHKPNGSRIGYIGYDLTDLAYVTEGGAVHRFTGNINASSLAGTGTRMVVADSNGTLSSQAIPSGGGGGTVVTVGVTSANGFAGTSSGGDNPALTLSTTVAGILQGNGTAISAATTTGTGAVVLASAVPTNNNQLTNGAGYITGYTETDPTIYAWAKAATKPSYSYSEISSTPTIGNGTLTLATSGSGISGSQTFTANQGTGATFTVISNATTTNSASTIVLRDGSGNVSLVGDFCTSSDFRLKSNIRLLSDADYYKARQIDFRKFTYTKDSTNRQHFGVIAQDVERILPEVVHTDEKGIKSVNYIDLLILLVSQQKDTIEKLEKRVSELEQNHIDTMRIVPARSNPLIYLTQ